MTNTSDRFRLNGHKEEVTRPSVVSAPIDSASQNSVLFTVKDTEIETLAVGRAATSADASSKTSSKVNIHTISTRKVLLEECHKNTSEPKLTTINLTKKNKCMSDIKIKNTQNSSSVEVINK